MQKEHIERQQHPIRRGHDKPPKAVQQHKLRPVRYSDKESHQTAENARQEAVHQAIQAGNQGKEKRVRQAAQYPSPHLHREESFEDTMEQVRKEMPKTTRPLSRFIHNASVERISDFLGKTLFRPNAILAGGITAFVAVLSLYFYAKYMSFTLQGSETIIAFCVGWLGGILYDFLRTMFTGRR